MDILTYLTARKTSQADFAKALGVSQGLVCQWIKKRRPVAADRCVAIERATAGAITRRDLRPDDWQEIWPELIGAGDRAAASDDVQPPVGVRNDVGGALI